MQLAKYIYRKNKADIWHIDATGSVVGPSNDRPIYFYTVVMAMDKGIPALPLYEFLTDLHNVGNLKMAFIAWWGHMSSIGVVPDIIVVDQSWELIHSLLFTFSGESIGSHLQGLWMTLSDSSFCMKGPRLRLCASHFLKAVSRRLSKITISRQVDILG